MRAVLADLKSDRGFVSKDTVVGGYGSRLDPFSRVTSVICYLKKQFHDVPSVHMAYVAAILARAGHEVIWTRDAGDTPDADVALVLSSLVDHRNETAWADRMRARGVSVGFLGITASKMPELFTEQRDRCVELCDQIAARGLSFTFEAETRLDRLDVELLDRLYGAGFRAMSFGVESTDPATLKKSGRRPIPQHHQRTIIDHCRKKGIVTAAFYVLGFLQDDWNSIAATIDYATDLGSTFAQFKILTPYPGTPMFKQIEPLLSETDWEKFDGYTPTFKHPNLTGSELRYLLGAAYKRFYMRPSYLANFLKIQNSAVRDWVSRMDERVNDRHSREEIADVSRPVAC